MDQQRTMSRPFFWIAFPAALFLGVLLTVSMPRDPVPMLVVALVWIAAAALAWNRWVSLDVTWLGRVAAGIGTAILALMVHEWLGQTDAFMIESKCDAGTGTFWSLFFVWLSGGALFTYSLFGKFSEIRGLTRLTIRPVIWWISILAWTAACAEVFVNNISMDVFIESMRMAGIVVGGIALVFGGIFGIGMLFSIPERRRRRQAAADFARVDEAARQDMLDLIDRHSRQNDFMLLYRPLEHAGAAASMARIGGDPVALPGETWPTNEDGSPAVFMMQLALTAPRLPAQWQGRVLTVFLADYSLLVRSYEPSAIPALTVLQNPLGETRVKKAALQELAVPYIPAPEGDEDEDEDEESGGFDTAQLLARIPELRARLEKVSRYPLHVLHLIIEGKAQVASEDAILAGGDPQLIQGAHEPLCPVCHQPMRFLLQFGDVTEDFELGDCGVGYIYGCDTHPGQCEGFVDCF